MAANFDLEDIQKLKIPELRKVCKDHNLSSSGNKAEIQQRLEDFYEKAQEEVLLNEDELLNEDVSIDENILDDDIQSASKIHPSPITLGKEQKMKPVTVAKVKPTPITVAKTQPTPITVAKAQPTPITVAKAQPTPITVAKAQPTPITVSKTQPTPITVAKAQPTPITVAKEQSNPETVAKKHPAPLAITATDSLEQPAEKRAKLVATNVVEEIVVPVSSPQEIKDKLEARKQRFGIDSVTDDSAGKKAARAARFGLVSSPSASDSADTSVSAEKLKARSERFGQTVSNKLVEEELNEKKAKRMARFGTISSDIGNPSSKEVVSTLTSDDKKEKLIKRAERFGMSSISAVDENERKQQRAKRFGVTV